MWVVKGGGGNSLLFLTAEWPVLIDTKVATMGLALRDVTKSETGATPGLVINTHHHADHTGGNFAFSDRSRIMAHVNVRSRMAATFTDRIRPSLEEQVKGLREKGQNADADALAGRVAALKVDDFMPGKRISATLDYNYGQVAMRIAHFGPAHTDGDILVYLPAQNVLHTGDLVFHEMHPFIDSAAGAHTRKWQFALREAINGLCDQDTIVVPGHGELTDITGLERQIRYFARARDAVEEAMKAGRTRDEITKLTIFEDYGGEQRRSRTLGTIYDELAAEA
jgi:glyoxylase-like metal-dependent hydrolase (beta-lactamase superfamily II)